MNILIFGPNGSGKGTQGTLAKDKYGLDHIESGAIFRKHIGGGTELGMKAKEYINKGELVPDDITIPMVLDVLASSTNGWLLDGFPRSLVQGEKLWEALQKDGVKLDYVIEIKLPREIAKGRIMGRRLCENNPNHPNTSAFRSSLPMATSAASAVEPSPLVMTTRTKAQSTSVTTSTTMKKLAPWLPVTSTRT